MGNRKIVSLFNVTLVLDRSALPYLLVTPPTPAKTFYPVRVRAFSATVPFRGRAVRCSNHRRSIVSDWRVAFVLVLEQKDTSAILRAQIIPEIIFMSAN